MNDLDLQINNLFPSPLFSFDTKKTLLNLEKIKQFEFQITESVGSIGIFKTLSNNVLNFFPEEKEIILNYFRYISNNILFYKNNDFQITTSWGVKAIKNSFSQFHSHKNSFYSGVYYIESDENSSPFEIDAYNFYPTSFDLIPEEYNVYNSSFWSIPPNKGRLLFFPSYLNHRIGFNESECDRYSIAFNLYPVGVLGNGDSCVNVMVT